MINLEKRKLLLSAATAFAGVALVSTGVKAVTRPNPSPILTQDPREMRRLKHLPNVPLLTHAGAEVRFYEDLIKDKKVVVNFMYTVCTKVCGPSTRNIMEARQLLGDAAKDIHFYSISLTPEHDDPAILRAYMKANQIDDGWTYLTGTQKNIETLRRALGFSSGDPVEDADVSRHAGMLRIIDEPMAGWSHASTLTSGKTIARMIRYELNSSV